MGGCFPGELFCADSLSSCRVDPVACSKDSILRSCQGASFTEVLHYHRCDSRSATRSEYFSCLLNLQVQHVTARLAVFLTGKEAASPRHPFLARAADLLQSSPLHRDWGEGLCEFAVASLQWADYPWRWWWGLSESSSTPPPGVAS